MIKANIYAKEIETFTVVFPEMYRLLDKVSSWNHQPFAARYLYSHADDLSTTIVLEDLKIQGFRLAERELGLDLKHCLLVMRNIARFHALSLVLYNEEPEKIKPFLSNIFDSDGRSKPFEQFFKGSVRSCAKEVETWQGHASRFADRIHKLVDKAMDIWMCAIKRNDSEFNVLTHGDLWANNMMFRYSDATGEVEEVRFVDFQLTHWTSASVDLQYFLNSSASPEVLEDFEVLTGEYYTELGETLALLGHQHLKPSATQFAQEFEKKSLFGVMSALNVRAVALPDRNNLPDFNKPMGDEDTYHLSDAFVESLKRLLPIYEKKGWI